MSNVLENKVPAVVLCLTATGLTVARSLAAHAVPVIGVDGSRFQIGHHSRAVKRKLVQSWRQPEMLLESLVTLAGDYSERPVMLAAGDDELEFMSRYSGQLGQHFIIPDSCNEKFTGMMLDKIKFYRACEKLGADIPVTFYPENLDDVEAASRSIKFPSIIKPAFGHAWRERFKGKKVLEINSAAEMLAAFSEYDINPAEMVLQEVVPGPEDNIAVFGGYFNRDAEPLSVFTARKTRQYLPMFGSASLCESRWYPEVAEMSMDLVSRMGYHGICGTEYKRDPRDWKWKLMEINFRPTLWYAITRAAGVDIVYDAYLDLLGLPVERKIGTQKNWVLWQYLARDLVSVFIYLKKREISVGQLLQCCNPKKEYAVLSQRDWQASLYYPFYVLHEYLRHR